MQTENSFMSDLKRQYQFGGMHIRLIFINVAIFLLINILNVFFELGGAGDNTFLNDYVGVIFTMPTDPMDFIYRPWTLFTYMFAHFDILHLLGNMIFLFFAGQMFQQLFDQKRLLYTYILGGIFGGLLEIIAHGLLPRLEMFSPVIVGASGSIMAIFIAMAFHRPNLKVMFFGIIPVRLIILALIFIINDVLNLSDRDGVAHFAHLGGAVLGLISIQNLHSPGNIINRAQQAGDWLLKLFSGQRSPKMRVKKGKQQQTGRAKTDEEYNIEAKQRQEKVDKILDKISKSGYESLSKKEKDFLFNQSKNG